MKKKMSDKHKFMAYVLSTDAELNFQKNITQKEIGDILGVSQSTIAQANKETALRLQNNQLQKELNEAKREIKNLRDEQNLSLPDNLNEDYHRKW